MPLDDAQLAQLRVLVGPSAWTYHLKMPPDQQANVGATFDVLQSIPLVAAEVLEAAGNAMQGSADPQVKKDVTGPLETEYFQAASGPGNAWLLRANMLRAQVKSDAAKRAYSQSVAVEAVF